MRKISFAPLFVVAFLTACTSVEVDSSTGTSTSTSTSTGNGGVGGAPVGPESFVRFSEGLPWCAVRASGKVVCWQPVNGLEEAQPLGDLTTIPGVDDATAATVERAAGCARRASGKVACWGTNGGGQLLSLATNGETLTTPTDLPGIEALAVSSMEYSTCVLRPGGQVTCFGNSSAAPPDVPGLNDATEIVSGGAVGCAVRSSGQVACWSGIGAEPTPVAFVEDATHVSAADRGTCVVHATGEVSCWPPNGPPSAVKIPGFAHAITVKAGSSEVCAIDHAGDVSCWPWDWMGSASATDIHDARDIGIYSDRCVIHTGGELVCGDVTGS